MTPNTDCFVVTRVNERGSALVGVLLLLMMMSALAAALAVSGRTETLVAFNHQSATQARAAAEAGLNHVVEVATTWVFEWDANGFSDIDAALDGLLADTSLLGIALGTDISIAGTTNVKYQVFVMDEDDATQRGADATQITGDADATNNEDGSAVTDNNRALVVRAVGYAHDDTSVMLEAVIAAIPLPAIVTGGDLDISGNATIDGTSGSVHSNAGLTVSGNPTVTGDATATGAYSETGSPNIGGSASGGATELPIPSVDASDHLFKADFVLESNGTMTCGDSAGCAGGFAYGATICGASPCNYWVYNAGDFSWTISGNDATNGTYYVEGPARISGNPGTALVPIAITIIAEGSIEISGNPDLTPDYPELLFVTDGDLKISGGIDTPLTAQGQILVHEQLMISGNPTLAGQIIVEDVPSVDPLVTNNTISGNPTITYNGTLGTAIFGVRGWREVRP